MGCCFRGVRFEVKVMFFFWVLLGVKGIIGVSVILVVTSGRRVDFLVGGFFFKYLFYMRGLF